MKHIRDGSLVLGEFLLSQECRIWLRLTVKPLAVLATLALFLWLGAWFDTQIANHIAHAEASETNTPGQLACPDGMVLEALLCYTPCPPGFTGLLNTCYKNCPSEYSDDGVFCRRNVHIFGKASYPRGAGTPLVCGFNQEAQAGLCYTKCPAGYTGVGPTCWQNCPPTGYTDDGAFCRRPFPLHIFPKDRVGRAAGVVPNACFVGTERSGALCYPNCKPGFSGAGPLCFQRCPAGYTDDGVTCRQNAHIFVKQRTDRPLGVPRNFVPLAIDRTLVVPKNGTGRLPIEFIDNDDTGITLSFATGLDFGDLLPPDNAIYQPDRDFEGVDFLRFQGTDGKNDSNIATITILVGNVDPNNAPVAIDRTIAVSEDTPITITVTCTDAENDELFYQLLDKPQHGDYQWLPPNTVIYTPTVDFVGTDSFTFQAHDGRDPSSVSTITLTVNAVNDAPVISTEPISTTRNQNAAIVLAATDVESDPISYSLITSPTHGSLSGEAPNLLYTPEQNFVGDDSFHFQATDAHGASSVATIQIRVQPSNTLPIAESLVVTTTQENELAINLTASDEDGDSLVYTLVTSPTQGTLRGEGDALIYTPKRGFLGTDSFTYKVNDGQADSAVATVSLQVVAAPNQATVAGIVFEDRNGNGQVDGDEAGVGGLLVTLTPTDARTNTAFTAITDAAGSWQIDGVGFGNYTVQIAAGGGIQLEQAVVTALTVDQRGVQIMEPAVVKVTGRPLFLPLVVR